MEARQVLGPHLARQVKEETGYDGAAEVRDGESVILGTVHPAEAMRVPLENIGALHRIVAAKRKDSLTKSGGKYRVQRKQLWEKVPMVSTSVDKDDEEPLAWLDLPRSTREPMTVKDANAARKALITLDDRTPQQRLLGEPPTWRSALAQKSQ